jgi:hypothetical protein
MLKEHEKTLCCTRSQIEEVTMKLSNKRPAPTREFLENAVKLASENLLTMEREAGLILRKLIDGKIQAVPYRQFGSNKVVLKAHFRLQLVKLLPDDLHQHLLRGADPKFAELLPSIDVVVDLFEPTDVPAHAVRAWSQAKCGLTLVRIGNELGLSKRVAHLAKQLGKAMEEAEIDDPYIRLTEKPAKASRWRSKRKPPAELSSGDA